MKKLLKKIEDRLEEMYPGKEPMMGIYLDGSWSVEVNGRIGENYRIGGELSGDSIESMEEQLKIKL